MQQSIYPGITNNSIEFFTHKGDVKFIQSGRVKPLEDLGFQAIEQIKAVLSSEPEVQKELESIFPNSEWQQIKMFVKCRYGGIDFTPDIKEGELKSGDYWDCPLRGMCSSEGKICKQPIYKNQELTFDEVKLIKHLTTTKTNETIAGELGMPLGSFHLMKKNLYQKLEIQTKQELTIIAVRLNVINV